GELDGNGPRARRLADPTLAHDEDAAARTARLRQRFGHARSAVPIEVELDACTLRPCRPGASFRRLRRAFRTRRRPVRRFRFTGAGGLDADRTTGYAHAETLAPLPDVAQLRHQLRLPTHVLLVVDVA